MITYMQEYIVFADMESEDTKYLKEQSTLREEKKKLESSNKALENTLAELQASQNDLEKKKAEEIKLFD